MSEQGPVTRYTKAEREADTLAHEATKEAARADRAEEALELAYDAGYEDGKAAGMRSERNLRKLRETLSESAMPSSAYRRAA